MYFPLPASFYAILSNSALVAGEDSRHGSAYKDMRLSNDVSQTLALSMRNGIIATFPEVRLRFSANFVVNTLSICHNHINLQMQFYCSLRWTCCQDLN